MKKFFLILSTVITCILIACGCAYFFHGKTIFIMNGILIVITFTIFNRLWKKIEEENNSKKLHAYTNTLLTSREKERQMLIEKQSLTWHDIATIVINLSSWPNLKDLFREKQMPALINLITISDLKKQITWSANFGIALENLNHIAQRTYDDEVLKMLTKIIHDVKPAIEGKEDYTGADKLLELIEAKANILCNFQI